MLRSFTGTHAIRSMCIELNGPAGEGLAKARESRPFTVFSYSLSWGQLIYIEISIAITWNKTLLVKFHLFSCQ